VKSLVYVASFAPSVGQSIVDMTKGYPKASGLDHVFSDKDGFVSMTLEGITNHFAQDLPGSETQLIAATQGPIRGKNFEEKVSAAAWISKPSWFVVSEKDRMIQPALQRANARQISAKAILLPTGHVPQLSKPTEVAKAIIDAATSARKQHEPSRMRAQCTCRPGDNLSIERTSSSRLRLPPAAARVKR